MTEVFFLLSLIVITDGIILYAKFVYDRPHTLDKELKADLIIGSDFWDSLALPFIFVLPFVWLQVYTQSKAELYFIPYIVICILTIISLFLLLKHRFKRYYLTNNGIVILNLLSNKYLTIQTDNIKGYSYRKRFRGSPIYLVATSQRKLYFSVRQIKSIALFKDYFKRHNVQYYEYDWLTGNNYKK